MSLHKSVLRRYFQTSCTQFGRENYDQFSMYFELMQVIPGGKELVLQFCEVKCPCPLGPRAFDALDALVPLCLGAGLTLLVLL